MEDTMEKELNNRMDNVGFMNFAVILDDMWRGMKKFYWIFLVIISAAATLFYVQARRSGYLADQE